jgi:membrane-associated phospholipid phosphatase
LKKDLHNFYRKSNNFYFWHVKAFIFFLMLCQILIGQTQFNLVTARELGLVGSGASLILSGELISRKTSILAIEDIEKLDPSKINFIDRSAIKNHSANAKIWSDRLLISSAMFPCISFIDPNNRNQIGEKATITLETYLLAFGTTYLTKTLVKRPRPLLYNPNAPMSEKRKLDNRYSFFSGHTSLTAASSFLTASLMTSNGNNQDHAHIIWSSAAAIPLVQGYLRWKAGKHFPTDIAVGYIVGAGLGILIPKLHEGF